MCVIGPPSRASRGPAHFSCLPPDTQAWNTMMFLPPIYESSETNTLTCLLALPRLSAHFLRSKAGWAPVKADSPSPTSPGEAKLYTAGSAAAGTWLLIPQALHLNNCLHFHCPFHGIRMEKNIKSIDRVGDNQKQMLSIIMSIFWLLLR